MTDSRGTTFAMSPLSLLDHLNRVLVARYGPALQPYPKEGGPCFARPDWRCPGQLCPPAVAYPRTQLFRESVRITAVFRRGPAR
jgi:hypothetical protein